MHFLPENAGNCDHFKRKTEGPDALALPRLGQGHDFQKSLGFEPLDLLLVNTPTHAPNSGLPLTVHSSVRAFASRLADLRALAPIGARGHILFRNDARLRRAS